MAEGREIRTIEDMEMTVPRAFDVRGALQCGFCQPGMICTAKALLDKELSPSDDQIREALGGNLCCCTGYTKIFEAVKLAADDLAGMAGEGENRPVPVRYGEPSEGHLVLGARGRKADSIRAVGTEIYADDVDLPAWPTGASSDHPSHTPHPVDRHAGSGGHGRRLRGHHRRRDA